MTARRKTPATADAAPDPPEERTRAARVTLADVAMVAGVSEATASRALRGNTRISQATRLVVRDAADRLRYVPNAAARSLVVRRSRTLGLLVADFSDPFHGQVATGFEAGARRAGHTAIIVPGYSRRSNEERAIRRFIEMGVDGIALAASVLDPRDARTLAGPVPVVLVHPEFPGIASPPSELPDGTIQFDDVAAIETTVEHLLSMGHRRIAYLGVGRGPSQTLRRRAAKQALIAAGAGPLQSLSVPTEAWRRPLEVAAKVSDPFPDAIICYDDKLALALMYGLQQRRVAVPGDVAIVGFDDIPFASLAHPGLTTIRTPTAEMGRLAADMLVRVIRSGSMPSAVRLPTELIVRGSSAAPRR